MHLNENLEICLLALASRYPGCLVEINEAVLARADLWQEDCTAEEALQRLLSRRPKFLQAPARLEINDQSVIYLLDRSEELPAFQIYSGKNHLERPHRPMLHVPNLVLDEGEEGDRVYNASHDVWAGPK